MLSQPLFSQSMAGPLASSFSGNTTSPVAAAPRVSWPLEPTVRDARALTDADHAPPQAIAPQAMAPQAAPQAIAPHAPGDAFPWRAAIVSAALAALLTVIVDIALRGL
jgi:hypothetical protein